MSVPFKPFSDLLFHSGAKAGDKKCFSLLFSKIDDNTLAMSWSFANSLDQFSKKKGKFIAEQRMNGIKRYLEINEIHPNYNEIVSFPTPIRKAIDYFFERASKYYKMPDTFKIFTHNDSRDINKYAMVSFIDPIVDFFN